jgi:hypothetical protein
MSLALAKRTGFWLVAFSLAFALVGFGCGDSKSSPDGEDGGMDGCSGGQRLLSVVGDPNVSMYPAEQLDLKVVFLEQCTGAVAGATVAFEIIGNPGDSSLSASSALTGANGLAKVTLSSGNQTGPFQVRAHSPEDPDGVYFSINLKPVIRQLYADGPTSLVTYTGESLEMSVKLMNLDSNSPVRGVDISFAINQPAPGDASIPVPVSNTNLSGLAFATFESGSVVTTYQVIARGSQDEVGSVTFNIQVKNRIDCVTDAECQGNQVCLNGSCHEPVGDECNSDDQCPEGYSCQDGFCRPEGTLPDSCDTSEDCPNGYYCENHRCYPCDENNQLPECQGGGDGCETDADCPPGFICINGVCYPDNPDDVVVPELGGTWYTEHYFNIRDSLPDFAATIADILSILNQAINFCEITGIGFVDDFLCDLIDEYIPDWVGTLISILDNLGNMLSELRAEGVMNLTHLNPRELLSGSETWDKILIRYLDACCEGQGAGCNPYNQPGFPDCATIDISRQDLEWADVGLVVHPFTGAINVDLDAINPYTLAIDERRVEIEFSKFVVFLIDLLIQIFTGYDNLEDALDDIINCQAIQNLVNDIWPGGFFGNPPDIIQTCENMKPSAYSLLEGLLDQIGFGWKVLKFDGWATITTLPGDPPYGTELGYSNHETSGDGYWDGTFDIIFEADITGSWHGER